jgi:glycosyltransferase involved in cell wall biosynthesis
LRRYPKGWRFFCLINDAADHASGFFTKRDDCVLFAIFVTMKVSILLPYYNAAPWIAETIGSIQGQSMSDWELICINDFSNDITESIVLELAKSDPRIKAFHNSSKGIIPALQLALSKASAPYITRIDADDLMTPNRLKLMSEILDLATERTIVTGKVQYFSENGVSKGFLRYEQWINERIDQQDHYQQLYRECVIASPNWMAQRKEIVDLALFDALRYPEDYDLVFQWFANDFHIECVHEVTLHWRDHPTRTSRTSTNYAQAALFKLKIDWFIRLHGKGKSIGILGAGTKGKLTTDYLASQDRYFGWYDFQFDKFKGKQGATEILDYRLISEEALLICIYPPNIDELEAFLNSKGYFIGQNAWYL